MPASADLLRDLRAFCAQGLAAPADDASFGALALRLFAAQYDGLPSYRAYCQRRGALPTRLRHWSEIPAVPVQAFRDVRLWWDEDGPPAAVFRTSGTTSAGTRPGEHYMSAGGLALYEASLLPAFRAYVLPELSPGARSPLVPYVLGTFAGHSSLGHMIDVVVRDCFDAPPRDLDALGPAACIFATDLALDAWLSAAEARGFTIALPPGSRLMHTGGPKGMKRSIPTGELYARALRALGIPASHCVNEYGMTELRSQFYDSVLRDGRDEPLPRRKHGPPWVRVSAHDPQTLDAVPAGTPGLLRVFDLANFGSALAIQTEDKAVVDDDGAFRLHGRAAGAEPRGCSLDAEALPA